jgi:WD40 repeat protein
MLDAEFSPDGKLIATGGADRLIRLWEVETGNLIKTFREHKMSITALKFSPDGRYIASSSLDRTIRLWRVS